MDLLMNTQVSKGGLAVYSIDEAQGQYIRKQQHLEVQDAEAALDEELADDR